jgi:hypothetical protein
MAGMLETGPFSGQMLDARCWITINTLTVSSKILQYPETRIQDQSVLATVSIVEQSLTTNFYATIG